MKCYKGIGGNMMLLNQLLSADLSTYIEHQLNPPIHDGILDKPMWKLEPRGDFSAKFAYDYVRRRRDPNTAYRNIWVKGLPFKVSFFMWKVWKNKLPLDDFFKRLGYLMASKCWCCVLSNEETMPHLFFTSYSATKVWN